MSKKPLNPVFHGYYEKRLNEGKKKKQAIICIMRKLVNILYSMIKNKTEYRLIALPEWAAS
ncbi:transposase [Paenibacillus sp. FSL H7-0357]|nr:transposase [Paenibacillus sp. FSL H7-0357]